jgi:hypothetical protein
VVKGPQGAAGRADRRTVGAGGHPGGRQARRWPGMHRARGMARERARPYALRVTPPSQPTVSVEDRDTTLAASVRLVRLRRRGAWTAIAGFVAFLVAISAYSNQYSDATDSGPAAVLAVAMVLGALTIAGLITAVVCTVLLGRRTAAQRAQAVAAARSAGRISAAQRQRRSRRGGLLIASGLLLVGLGAAALFLPGLVNGVAYLAGGHTVTFVPQSHDVSCSYHGNGDCSIVTVGILETGGAGVRSTWPHDVPLNQPLRVRKPVWTWGLGAALIDSDGIAVGAALISLLFDGLAVFAIVYAVGEIRRRPTS